MRVGKLKDDWKGEGSFREIANWMNMVARFVNAFRVGSGLRMVPNAAGGVDLVATPQDPPWVPYPLIAWVGGKAFKREDWTPVDGSKRTRYVLVYFDGVTPPAYIEAGTYEDFLSEGMPDDAEAFDLLRTFGDIHVPRA